MYIAYDKGKNIYNALDQNITKDKTYYCPACMAEVRYKKGKKIQSHFAHININDCSFHHYKKESSEHLQAKKSLYQYFQHKGKNVSLEYIFKTKNNLQIADIYIGENNLALEYQRSVISYEVLQQRTLGYKEAGIKLIWLLDINKFVKEEKFNNDILYIKYAAFVDNFLNYKNGCVFFYGYDYLNESICVYQIWPNHIKKRYAFAKKWIYHLKDINFPLECKLIPVDKTGKLYQSDIEKYITNTLKFDKTVKNKILSALYNQRINLTHIPNHIGINFLEQVLIRNNLLLWQLEMNRLVNEQKSYQSIFLYMSNYLKIVDSIYINEQTKRKIIASLIKKYYTILITSSIHKKEGWE